MSSLLGKSFDYLNGIAELSGKIASALQSFIAARTAIRDFVISTDEKHYADVERLTAHSMDVLEEADTMVEKGQQLDVICPFLDSIEEWSEIAGQVRDGFSGYQEIINNKVLTNFAALAESGNTLLQNNVSLTTGVMLDVQIAHVAVVSYLLNGEDRFVEDARHAIDSARAKIEQVKQNKKHKAANVQSFVAILDAYAESFFEATASRINAYAKFNESLAPLGAKIQFDIEQFHLQLMDIQQGINEMKILQQQRKKDAPPLH